VILPKEHSERRLLSGGVTAQKETAITSSKRKVACSNKEKELRTQKKPGKRGLSVKPTNEALFLKRKGITINGKAVTTGGAAKNRSGSKT